MTTINDKQSYFCDRRIIAMPLVTICDKQCKDCKVIQSNQNQILIKQLDEDIVLGPGIITQMEDHEPKFPTRKEAKARFGWSRSEYDDMKKLFSN